MGAREWAPLPAGRAHLRATRRGATILPENPYMERVANIGGKALRRRQLIGLAGVVVTAGLVWAQSALGLPRGVRLLAFGPLLVAAYGLMQSRERTCVRLAARGQRDMGRGLEEIEDAAELYRVRRQAAVVHASALIGAAAGTAVLYVI